MFTRVHSASPRSASQQQPKSRTPGWTLLEDTARIAPQADHRPPSLPSWKNMRFLLKMMSQTHARPGIPSRAGKITASRPLATTSQRSMGKEDQNSARGSWFPVKAILIVTRDVEFIP